MRHTVLAEVCKKRRRTGGRKSYNVMDEKLSEKKKKKPLKKRRQAAHMFLGSCCFLNLRGDMCFQVQSYFLKNFFLILKCDNI